MLINQARTELAQMSLNLLSGNSNTNDMLSKYQASQNQPSIDASKMDRVSFSEKGKAMAKLDSLHSQIDKIYYTYLSKDDIKEMKSIYAKVDKEFGGKELTQAQQDEKDKLLDKVKKIMEDSKDKMKDKDLNLLNKLEKVVDAKLVDGKESLKDLSKEQEDILEGQLSSREKSNVETINNKIKSILGKGNISPNENRELNALFKGLNTILDRSYDRLSSEDKLRVDEINKEIVVVEEKLKEL
jgi:predicted RNA-binding protein with EMAP domain